MRQLSKKQKLERILDTSPLDSRDPFRTNLYNGNKKFGGDREAKKSTTIIVSRSGLLPNTIIALRAAKNTSYSREASAIREARETRGKTGGKFWQSLNEVQKLYKSQQMIKSLYRLERFKDLKNTQKKIKQVANIVSKLETRLDVIVYRLQLASSITQARDFIKKGYIKVNSTVNKHSGHYITVGSKISSTNINSAIIRINYSNNSPSPLNIPHHLYHTSYLSGILLYNPFNIVPLTESYSPFYRYFNNSFSRP